MRLGVRLGVVTIAASVAAAATFSTPAFAHVEVSADKPQAGATNVTVTFNGEAESTTGGIQSEQVFLPAGITPEQVQPGKVPAGWTMTRAVDNVTVSGKALPIGTDAEWSFVVAQLPFNATELVFKTLETYSDGEVVRWIDPQAPGQAEPEHPAPTLKLTAAVASATHPSTGSPAGTPSSASAAPGTDSASKTGLIIAIVVIVLLALAVIVAALRRRRRGGVDRT